MIKVMSFNIRYGLAPDGENHWHHRKQLALARIRAFDPDLLGLQECRDDEQAEFVRQGLPGHHFYGIHRGGPGDTALEMAPLLFRQSSFSLLDSGCFWLSETPEVAGSMSWDSAYARTVSWAKLACRTTGRVLTYANTHFDYEPSAVVNHARCLRHWLDQIGMPLILTGDFNADKDSESYQLLTGSTMGDAFRLSPPAGADEITYHAYGQEEDEERAAIDWILISDHFRVITTQIDRTRAGHLFPSDHYPITAVLDWQK
ncbi:MAG: endonuclease/exonuclease/phosphatase family protein [Proteobacteria bacterium]|nr:endonuclease/exonuclease/phosphatase family protein [Pseudomonadota bacterium]